MASQKRLIYNETFLDYCQKTLETSTSETHFYCFRTFHTLVKLVYAEDIANNKICTHVFTLEVNKVANQLQTQTLDAPETDQLMFT